MSTPSTKAISAQIFIYKKLNGGLKYSLWFLAQDGKTVFSSCVCARDWCTILTCYKSSFLLNCFFSSLKSIKAPTAYDKQFPFKIVVWLGKSSEKIAADSLPLVGNCHWYLHPRLSPGGYSMCIGLNSTTAPTDTVSFIILGNWNSKEMVSVGYS